jgi:hypothetical protein
MQITYCSNLSSVHLKNIHRYWSYDCTPDTANVFEIGITLPGHSDASEAASTLYRLQLSSASNLSVTVVCTVRTCTCHKRLSTRIWEVRLRVGTFMFCGESSRKPPTWPKDLLASAPYRNRTQPNGQSLHWLSYSYCKHTNSAAKKRLSVILCIPMDHCRIHNSPFTISSYQFLRLPNQVFPWDFTTKSLYALLQHTCCMHIFLLDLVKWIVYGGEQIMKLLMQLFPVLRWFLSLRPEYSSVQYINP